MDPKMGLSFGPTIRILLKPDSEAQFWVPKTDPKMGPKIEQKNQKKLEETREKKRAAKGTQKGPHTRKPGHLEIIILWVHTLACFPKSRLQVAAEVHTYMAPKASTCGCDHSKEKASVVT